MKHTFPHRLFALLLTLALCVGFVPRAAQAAETEPQFAKVSYFSKISNACVGDSACWDDGWFLADAAERNDGLALLSAQLSASAADANGGAAFLTALGFDAASRRFDSADPDDCAYTLGTKTVAGRTVVAVVFQGDLYGAKGWRQNVTVNGDEPTADQASYAAAARTFLADLDGMGFGSDAVLWLTGQSRAGAVANLAAAYLLERDEHPTVLAYTLEAPATTENPDAHGDAYRAIHNYICDDDPVVMLPIWGMTRYGQEHVYNHVSSVEDTLASLLRQNPGAAETVETYAPDSFEGGVRAYLEQLLGVLYLSLPDRASYSAPNTAVVPNVGTITFTYQNGLRALCRLAFGGGVDAAGLKDKLYDLVDYLPDLAYACMEETYAAGREDADALRFDAAARRWAIADAVFAMLDEASAEGVAREDCYALLRLLSPLVTDLSPLADEGFTMPEREGFEDLGYVDWSLIFRLGGAGGGTLLFSHKPDVVLARLKLLAPLPALDDVALTIDEPKAGDALNVTPDAAASAVPLTDWLSVRESAWVEPEGDALRAGWTYYLRLTLAVIGHSVPDGFAFTVNDRAPLEYDVTYQDGEALITGVWDFTVGEPEQVSVSFDTNGHGDPQETLSANAGALLRHSGLTPAAFGTVKDDTGLWRFDGWFDADGTPWANASAGGGVTLTARWTRLVGDIALTYDIPHVGDSGDALTRVTVPENALYRADEIHLYDGEWNDVSQIETTEPHSMYFVVRLNDDGVAFQSERDEYGALVYAGTLTLNGESFTDLYINDHYDDDTGEYKYSYLSLSYEFNPLPRQTSGGGGGGGSSSSGNPSSQGTGKTEPTVTEPQSPVFTDVPEGAWYADAVAWAAARGIVKGTDETHFSPSAPCTRAQTAVFLWRAAGSPEPSGAALPFGDVPGGAYYEKAVRWAYEQGIVKGVDEARFDPEAPCTRAQGVTFLHRYAKAGAAAGRAFADVPDSAWYAEAVAWAAATGVTTGTDSTHFGPDDICTRAHIVTFLFRHMGGAA